MALICPRCVKSRIPIDKYVHKDGKRWKITCCLICSFNFDIEEAPLPLSPPPPTPKIDKKTRRFKFGLDRDEDLE